MGLPACRIWLHDVGDLTHIDGETHEHGRELGGREVGSSDEWATMLWNDDDGGWSGADAFDESDVADFEGW